jgi:hypothetical protein
MCRLAFRISRSGRSRNNRGGVTRGAFLFEFHLQKVRGGGLEALRLHRYSSHPFDFHKISNKKRVKYIYNDRVAKSPFGIIGFLAGRIKMAAKTKKTPNRKIYIPEYFGGEDGWGPVGPPEGGYPTDPPGWGEYPPWPLPDDPIPPEPSGGGPVAPDPGYEVQIYPQTRVILQGRTAVFTISIIPDRTFVREPMSLTVWPWNETLQNSSTPSFSLNPIPRSSLQGQGPFRITLAISTLATIPLGLYGFNLGIVQMVFGRISIDNRVPEGRLAVTRLHRPTLKAPPVG